MTFAIETRGLVRTFGDFTAVDHIDLQVPQGCFFGFLGPNGAGKSSSIKMLTGLLQITAGQAFLLGHDVEKEAQAAKALLGVVPEDLALFDGLSAPENLAFVGRMHGLDGKVTASRTRELLELMALVDVGGKLVADFSHGMKKKLALAAALIHGPKILFLDEPFEGIDAVASQHIRHLLGDLTTKGVTIFLTSHILEIVEKLCTHAAVIDKGRLVAQGPVQELGGVANDQGSLEEVFLSLVDAGDDTVKTLSWL